MNPITYLALTAVGAAFQLGFITAAAFTASLAWHYGKKLVG